jgi:chromate transporter
VQLVVVAAGAVAGVVLCRSVQPVAGDGLALRYGPKLGWALLALFGALLVGLPVIAYGHGGVLAVAEAFYRAGALVFGGGHVVLPLLQETVVAPGWVSPDDFLAGYGAAQAVPGPLFTFAAYLGAVMDPSAAGVSGWTGAVGCLLAIFLPAWLLVVGALPFWDMLRQRPEVQSTLAGVNAGVVGILLAALYDPVWTSAIGSRWDFALALAAFGLLVYGRVSPVVVVALAALAGAAGAVLWGS